MSVLLPTRYILLADDDKDDSILFQDALEELPLSARLKIIYNGEELMKLLTGTNEQLPDTLFLDVNMPRKNGFECLSEIRQIEKLKQLPVIILSTSNDPAVITLLYEAGAHYYMRKPNDFEELKKVIHLALTLTEQMDISQPPIEKFVLSS